MKKGKIKYYDVIKKIVEEKEQKEVKNNNENNENIIEIVNNEFKEPSLLLRNITNKKLKILIRGIEYTINPNQLIKIAMHDYRYFSPKFFKIEK